MLYQSLVVLHMLGLSISVGTGIYLAAVARHAARHLDQAEARTLLPGVNGAISNVGSIGLALLLLSGVGMLALLGGMPPGSAFRIKMALVVVIVLFVGGMQLLARRLRRGSDAQAAQRMRKIAPLGPLLAVLTLTAAVAAFH